MDDPMVMMVMSRDIMDSWISCLISFDAAAVTLIKSTE